ncbi:MAG: actin-binding WH2 domain-containing protein [Bacteroidetes bacterium]|nr:actin-binding WH2 domain-containing protein [Bacteroidota bacterium]
MTTIESIHTLLQDKATYINKTVRQNANFGELFSLFTAAVTMLFFYGFVMGIGHSPLQALATAIKLPILIVLTSVICFPTLYFFLSILDVKLHMSQLSRLGIVSMSLMSISLTAFVPVVLFFLITTNSYPLFKLINVLVFTISGFVGLRIYFGYISTAISLVIDDVNRRKAKIFIRFWLLLYAIVGAQLSWTLSPFIRDPSRPFILFTVENSNFFADVIHSLHQLMGF